jgi:hypothetical protein
MKRSILLLLLSTISLLAAPPWPGVQFTEVRAYAWPGDKATVEKALSEFLDKPGATLDVILPGMKLKPGVINKDGAPLTPDQVKRLLAAVIGKHPMHAVAGCHIPHNAFVFYDAARKPVAFIQPCFACLTTRSEPDLGDHYLDIVTLATIFDELNLPMGSYPNLKAFKEHFDAWEKSRLRLEKSRLRRP